MEQKTGEGKQKIFKMGGKLIHGVGALKRGGVLEPPYKLWAKNALSKNMIKSYVLILLYQK